MLDDFEHQRRFAHGRTAGEHVQTGHEITQHQIQLSNPGRYAGVSFLTADRFLVLIQNLIDDVADVEYARAFSGFPFRRRFGAIKSGLVLIHRELLELSMPLRKMGAAHGKMSGSISISRLKVSMAVFPTERVSRTEYPPTAIGPMIGTQREIDLPMAFWVTLIATLSSIF